MKNRIICFGIMVTLSSLTSICAYGAQVKISNIFIASAIMSIVVLVITVYVIQTNKKQKGQSIQFLKYWRDTSMALFILSMIMLTLLKT